MSPAVTQLTRTFGPHSNRRFRRRPHGADTRDVDDRPTVRLLLHHVVRRLRHPDRRQHVQGHDALGVAGRRGGGVGGRRATGVVDHDVEATLVRDDRVDQGVGLVRLPHIGLDEDHAVRQRLGFGAPADDDRGTGVEESPGDAAADAARPAGDQRDASREIEGHGHA